ncbi:hypothetical protein A2U01_0085286, partial [Trifolium medium]|nr:hypothetical protein [Trifolium medium]
MMHIDLRNNPPEPIPEPLSIELLKENFQKDLERAAYLRDVGVMTAEELAGELAAIQSRVSRSLKRTFD